MPTSPPQTASAETSEQPLAADARAGVRRTRPEARIAALLVWAALFGLWSASLGIPNDSVQVFAWLWLAVIAWNIEAPPRSHLAFLRDWSLPLLGLVIYFYSRGFTDEWGLPVHFQMPVTVDEWLGGGITLTERLQDAWCGDPCLRTMEPAWFDRLLTTVYASHFVTGLTIAAVLWVRDRVEWLRWMRRYLLINFAALAVYIVYPMAPPWLAWHEGYIQTEIHRVTSRGWQDTGLGRFDLVLQGVGNPVAAMPSLHAGVAFLIGIYGIQRLRTPWRWLLAGYPALMSIALIYFAEHYVIDIVAGALLAMAVLTVCRRWDRRRPPANDLAPLD